MDFFTGWLVRARHPESCGDEDAAELAAHVRGRGLGLAGVSGRAGEVALDVGGGGGRRSRTR